mgnify:CR=1 FL=1
MKKLLVLFLCVSVFTLTACSNGEPPTTSNNTSISDPAASVSTSITTSTQEIDATETSDKIIVTMELDEVMSQAIVNIQNESNYIFDGSISVYFNDSTGKQCDDDMIFVDDLAPGNFTYARINLADVYAVRDMEYKISNKATFTPAPATSGGTLDEEASQQLSSDFEGSFGGAGNPEYATSWYHFTSAIEVYDGADGKYAIVTVSGDADQESIDRIVNTIFGNYAKTYELLSVKVITDDGTEVFLRSA